MPIVHDFGGAGGGDSNTDVQPITGTYAFPVALSEPTQPDDASGPWAKVNPASSSALPYLRCDGELGASVTREATFTIPIPQGFATATHTMTVRVRAQYVTAANTATDIDIEAYADDGGGSDINTTAAQNLTNSYADYDFTITDTALAEGEYLTVVVRGVMDDTGGTNNPEINCIRLSLVVG